MITDEGDRVRRTDPEKHALRGWPQSPGWYDPCAGGAHVSVLDQRDGAYFEYRFRSQEIEDLSPTLPLILFAKRVLITASFLSFFCSARFRFCC